MLVCGVEFSGNDAIISLIKMQDEIFHLPDCRVRRITCANPDRVEDLLYFQKTMAKLAEDYKIELFVIRERQKKGKFSGGANGFKLEAALQLTPGIKTLIMGNTQQKENLKHYPLPITFAETGLKQFQEAAFMVGFSYFAGNHVW